MLLLDELGTVLYFFSFIFLLKKYCTVAIFICYAFFYKQEEAGGGGSTVAGASYGARAAAMMPPRVAPASSRRVLDTRLNLLNLNGGLFRLKLVGGQ